MSEEKTVNINSLLGKKIGMTQIFDEAGNVVPVTVIETGPCVVKQVKTKEKDGYAAVQIGFGIKKLQSLREIRIDDPAEFKVGQEIKVEIFKVGELVHVFGKSIGKGFAGTVKLHNYSRGPMTHGSKSHRITGSIGAGTSPGRVWKGKAMPGRMGGDQVMVKNLQVVKVDAEKNLLLLRGAVPGKPGNLLIVRKGQ